MNEGNKRTRRMVRKTVKLWEDREIRHFSIKGKKAVRGKWKKKRVRAREQAQGKKWGRKEEIQGAQPLPPAGL